METKQLIVPTEDELKQFHTAFFRTYGAIGDDAGFKDGTPMSEITEVVLDADRVRTFGALTPELYEKFDAWVMQEIAADYKKGMRRLAKFFFKRR